MGLFFRIFIFVILISFSFAQSTNTTVSNSTLPQIICTGTCGSRGICIAGEVCVCFQGFFGTTCQLTMADFFPIVWPFLQYFFSVVYVVLFLLGFWVLLNLWIYRNKMESNSASISSNKIAIWVMILYVTYEITCIIIFFVDPLGTVLLPFWLITIWTAYRIVFGVSILGLILFHWIEVFYMACTAINTEQQLSKISVYNKGRDVSLDDIIRKTNTLFRMKIPYIICVGIISLYQIPAVITQLQYSPVYFDISIGNLVLLSVFYFLFSIAFVIYGRKISSLIPPELTNRFKYLNIKVQIYCIVGIIITLGSILIGIYWPTPAGQLCNSVLVTLNQWVMTPMIYSNYVRFNFKSLKAIIEEYLDDSESKSKISYSFKEGTA